MLTPQTILSHFERALRFDQYIATGTPGQKATFQRVYDSVSLEPEQRAVVAGFQRSMPVLVLSGLWCGDCSAQCPILARIAQANPSRLDVRFVDRDEHRDLADQVMICGGHRVPTVIWAAEDFEFIHLLGDRTLSRYRRIAATQLGPACPVPGAESDPDELSAAVQDWVNEFERVHLILRTSPRLRERHAD